MKKLREDNAVLLHVSMAGVAAELKSQFSKENFFNVWVYMRGILDFDGTTHQMGKYFLECKYIAIA